jgi:chemotaxis signal transduction protein
VMQERRYDERHLKALKAEAEAAADAIQVLVCNHEGHAVGLVVERIVDIIEDRADVKSAATRTGVQYAAVIQERMTEILNLEVILSSAPVVRQQVEEHVKVGD